MSDTTTVSWDYVRKYEEMRAENERLKADIQTLFANNGALTNLLGKAEAEEQTVVGNFENLALEYGKLEAEVERLRALLKEIHVYWMDDEWEEGFKAKIARALEGK